MGLLDKLGLTREKKARPVGQQLEKGRREQEESTKRNVLIKCGIFVLLLVLTLLAFPRGEVYEYTVQVGDVWRQPTLVAPFNFPIYKDPATLEEEREEVRQNTPPYFRELPGTRERITANRDTVQQQVQRILDAYTRYRRHLQEGRELSAAEDSVRYHELRRDAWVKLSNDQWRLLTQDYIARIPGIPSEQEGPVSGTRLDQRLMQDAWEFAMQVTSVGVMNEPRETVLADEIIIRNEEERIDRSKSKDNVYGLNEAHEAAEDHFQDLYPDRQTYANISNAFFRAIFEPSLEYMRAETVAEWQRREANISPTRDVVQEGEIIVRNEERVTPEIKRMLTSLERVHTERRGETILWQQFAGEFILTLATFLIFFLYLFFLRREAFNDNRTVFLIALLFAGIIGLFALVVRIPTVGLYIVPVAIASVQLTIMFDSRVGLFGTLTLALIGGLILGLDMEYFLATFFAGTLGVFSVRDIKNRGQYFLSGALVMVGYLVILAANWLLFNTPSDRVINDIGLVAVNSLCVILAYPLLWVFERSFDITTDLTLLELSDTNRKLLKELSLRAPGSFNHTLQVANLAEAAADAIGANTLLVRVGALYHDIGKMLKPEYFVENQRSGENPHDRLKPRMSALIIASHVKEGLEMGRQHNLPHRVLKFIPAHHGTTRIEFFYRQAIEENTEEDPDLLESEFRYPGPRPDSRETGILMLADAVEAASRSLDEPTHKRLKTLIDAIFQARIEDGQLRDTDLTFRDLTRIKETFLSMLTGIYHVRVKYPDQEKEEKEVQEEDTAEAGERVRASKPLPDHVREEMEDEGVWGTPSQAFELGPFEASTEESDDTEVKGDGMSGPKEPAAPARSQDGPGEGTDEQPSTENGAPETEASSEEQKG